MYIKKEYSKVVYAIEIATERVRKFESVTKAAAFAGRNTSNLRPAMLRHRPVNGWVYGYEADLKETRDAAKYYKRNGEYARKPKEMQTEGLVELRLDARTVIMVTPDKANEKYAEKYRKKLESSRAVRYEKEP